jgi:hypothetical protein
MLNAHQTITQKVRSAFEARFANFHLHETDWRRLEFAADLATGDSALDVGTAHGVLLHLLAERGFFSNLTAFDIRLHSQAWIREDVSYISGSISDPDLRLEQHDTVFCMEVLEHLPEEETGLALHNLRAAASSRLIISVPYKEPEPLWWHDKPGGHRQRFDEAKLAALFPTGLACIFPRSGIDWIFVVEDRRLQLNHFRQVAFSELAALLPPLCA